MQRPDPRFRRGEHEAFAELYDSCGDRLYRYLLSRLGHAEDAAEVLQETFLRLVRARRKLAAADNPVGFAFAVARNEALRRLAQRRGKPESIGDLTATPTGGDEMGACEDRELIAAGLERLPEDQREIVELKLFGELTFREIAEITGIPQGTAATRYRTALAKLKTWISEQVS